MSLRTAFAAFVCGTLLNACVASRLQPRSDSVDADPNANNEETLLLQGAVQVLGPVAGAQVRVYRVDAVLMRAFPVAGPVTADATGVFGLEVPAEWERTPLLLMAYNGSYTHPLTGTPVVLGGIPQGWSDAGEEGVALLQERPGVLEALWHVGAGSSHPISVLSTFASRAAVGNMLWSSYEGEPAQALEGVAKALGKSLGWVDAQNEGLDIRGVSAVEVSQPAASALDSAVWAATAYVAGMFQWASEHNTTGMQAVHAFAQDIADGSWDGAAWELRGSWTEIRLDGMALLPSSGTQQIAQAVEAFVGNTSVNVARIPLEATLALRTALTNPHDNLFSQASAPWFAPLADWEWSEENSFVHVGGLVLDTSAGAWGTPEWHASCSNPTLFPSENISFTGPALTLMPANNTSGVDVCSVWVDVPYLKNNTTQETVMRFKRQFQVTVP